MRVSSLLSVLAVLPLVPALGQAPAANLLADPGLEEMAAGGTPAAWEPLSIGAPAQFAADEAERRGGRRAVRIVATEITRSYWRSEPIPVVPGERIRVTAWVKHRDKPVDKGTVIAIAEFTDAAGGSQEVAKVGVATPDPGWQLLDGIVTATPGATRLRLRLGFSYSMGTCWWDDVAVRAEKPLVGRLTIPSGRLLPDETIPLTLLNREGRRGTMRARVQVGERVTTTDVVLTGEKVQEAAVPLEVATRGKTTVRLVLEDPVAADPLFTAESAVLVPPPVVLLPPIPTHWIREEGEPRLEGEIELAVAPAQRRGASLDARLLDAAGAVKAAWQSSPAGAAIANGVTRFSLAAPGLREGEYRLVARLRPAEGEEVAAEQPWEVVPRRKVRVTLNAAGYPEQDGRAIFPLGIFNGGAKMAEAGAAGFTVSHAYNAAYVTPGQRPDDQRARGFLDSTLEAGMRAIFMVPAKFANAGDWESFRRRIRMFRNHPGLLAWDEEEGLARGDMKPETLARIRQVLQEEDPNHPFMVGDSRDAIGRMGDRSRFFPLQQMDMGMWWWYPIPLAPKAGDALQGEDPAAGLELEPPNFLVLRDTEKPIWVGVQSYKKPAPTARYPNPTEYRAQAYIALIHGAKGLMWYGGSVTGGLFLSAKEGHWDYLKTLATELNALAPVFMSPNGQVPGFLPTDAPLSVALKRAPGRDVLLAANRGPNAFDATFRLPGVNDGQVPVLGEGRSAAVVAGSLRDHFDAYAVHVYELPAAGG